MNNDSVQYDKMVQMVSPKRVQSTVDLKHQFSKIQTQTQLNRGSTHKLIHSSETQVNNTAEKEEEKFSRNMAYIN